MAVKSFSSLVELEENSENLLNYGVALWETGDHEGGFEAFTKSLDSDPANGDAVVNLVEAGYNLNRYSDVEYSLNLAANNGRAVEVLSLLADCQFRQGKYEKAIDTLNGLLENEPENEETKQLLDLIRAKMGKKEEKAAVV